MMAARAVTVADQAPAGPVQIDKDDIGGVVTDARGPEAGVWVIAETTDLPTRFVRIVVTDDQGRYLLPDLPKATYSVWVRGYGLVDSPKVQATPGKIVNLTAVIAANPHEAAQYYPAGYWFSLLHVPAKSEFPGTPANGISPQIRSQAEWLRNVKSGGCWACHQLGDKATREIPPSLGKFPSMEAAWARRIQSGQAGPSMIGGINQLGSRALTLFADWSDRMAKGELPPAPPRPEGLERNVVITQWDWADPKAYLHDEVSTDRRNPTANAGGLIYGSLELSADYLPVLDPVRHTTSQVPLTVRDPNTPRTSPDMPQPSPYWGSDVVWTSRNNVHNPMFDGQGRVWLTSAVRGFDNPDYCKDGSSHPSARLFPIARSFRHLAYYDPKTKKIVHVGTCFSTHHLMFAEDANHTLWTSGGGQVVGWLNTKMFDETGDEAASQGWTALIIDTNGNGKRDAYVEPDQKPDPAKDTRYGGARSTRCRPRRTDPSGARCWASPARSSASSPGAHPPETALAEVYEPPMTDRGNARARLLAARHGHRSQRRRLGRDGQRPHGQLRSSQVQGTLERAEGDRAAMPRGLDVLHRAAAADAGRHRDGQRRGELLHVGRSVRHARAGREHADRHRQRVGGPARAEGRPLGRAARAVSARVLHEVDGWPHRRPLGRLEGAGAVGDVSTRTPFHMETGKGTTSKVMHFQLRPDPLAK